MITYSDWQLWQSLGAGESGIIGLLEKENPDENGLMMLEFTIRHQLYSAVELMSKLAKWGFIIPHANFLTWHIEQRFYPLDADSYGQAVFFATIISDDPARTFVLLNTHTASFPKYLRIFLIHFPHLVWETELIKILLRPLTQGHTAGYNTLMLNRGNGSVIDQLYANPEIAGILDKLEPIEPCSVFESFILSDSLIGIFRS